MHGVTKQVVLTGTFEGRGSDPWGGQRIGYSAHTKLNRKDFGLNWNAALETGGVLVSDEIRIEINVEAVLQK
jgi:polyisoprenoid-binding protein YceI